MHLEYTGIYIIFFYKRYQYVCLGYYTDYRFLMENVSKVLVVEKFIMHSDVLMKLKK